jgi:hypothetical protein
MVTDFMVDEDRHLSTMVSFIASSWLDDELRAIANLKRASTAADWAPFAMGCNGSGYRANGAGAGRHGGTDHDLSGPG